MGTNAINRLDNRDQKSDAGIASVHKATTETLREFKETLGQFCLGKDAETSFRNQISSLEKTNGTLQADKTRYENKVQHLNQKLEEARRHLVDCQGQLQNRQNELEAARAAPVEDPRLSSQIHELKKTKQALETQLENAKQAVLDAQNETMIAREGDAKKVDHTKEIEQKLKETGQKLKDTKLKLDNAMDRINGFEAEKTSYQADQERKDSTERQKLAQRAHEQQQTEKVKYQAELENSKQRLEQQERKYAQALQQLEELQAKHNAQNQGPTDPQQERVTYLQQTKQQMQQVQQLINRVPNQKTSIVCSQDLQSIKKTATDTQRFIVKTLEEHSQTVLTYLQQTKQQMQQVQQLINRVPNQKTSIVCSQDLQSIKKTATDTQRFIVKTLEEHSQTVLTAAAEQKRIEGKVRKSGAMEIEKIELEQENILLKGKIEELQQQRVWSGVGQQSSVNNTPARNVLQKADDDDRLRSIVRDRNHKRAKELNITPRNNSNVENQGSLRRTASLNAISFQSTKTGPVPGETKNVFTPQGRENGINAAFSGSFGETNSQQQAPSSLNSSRSIIPFSAIGIQRSSPSNNNDRDPVSLIDCSPDQGPDRSDNKSTSSKATSSKATEQAIADAASSIGPQATGSRHFTGTNGGEASGRKASFPQHGPSKPSPHDAMPVKSAMKKPKQNPTYASEGPRNGSKSGKEEILNPPRQALGMDNIRGVRSGATSSNTVHQSAMQHSHVDSPDQGSPPAAPVSRFQKRQHDGMGLSNAPKRRLTIERTRSRTRSGEIPDSQDTGKTL